VLDAFPAGACNPKNILGPISSVFLVSFPRREHAGDTD